MIEANINHIIVGNRFRKDFGNIPELADSIEELGLLQPIGVDSGYRLVFGERRLRAFKHLGRETIPVLFVNLDSIIKGEYAENEMREAFKVSERVAIGLALEEQIGNRQGQRTDKPLQVFAEVESGQTNREVAAEKAGFGNPETYRQAKKIVAEAAPSVVDAVDVGDVSINLAAQFIALPVEAQQEAIAAIAEQHEPIKDVIREAVKKAHVANNSGNNEWYTPAKHIELARQVMGGIDTDPATSEIANRTVKATQIFTADDDGRAQVWGGRVWMNPPYAQPLMGDFAEAVSSKYESGEIEQACILVNNATETQWFQRMLSAASAVCFPKSRIKFLDPEGNASGAPLQGQAIVYMGENVKSFQDAFQAEGKVLING